ncbi:FprA family A-type flavoprotein [Geobacter sp. DSM 9736]|uniref:FprA family A-type flavoprotein n=1 Tax=Geobacter sp. DSM 9736 TaxID=1277350 RepID=UPI000B507DB8|nr:FprA family A-type flavoprotein [Geobacter sp. DSM 9736]SNB47702.1 Flavorubredoxin [Geobacter sp. DSM 9736]
MDNVVETIPGIWWVGVGDPELRVFDDLFPTEHGTTYNAYLVKGRDRIALIDTVKGKRSDELLAKVKQLCDPSLIDYIVVNHTEPDHSGSLAKMLQHCPHATVVSTQAARTFLGNLIHTPFNSHVIKDGEVLDLGGRRLRFIVAPFLHWPDTMFTLVEDEGVLFTCDAFGAHYCGGSIFNDQLPDITADMKFYFDCLVRPFKDKVLAAIEKLRNERVTMICPSHGPVLRTEPLRAVELYESWSQPPAGGKRIAILYLSPHGNTEKMAAAVARGAALPGVEVVVRHINELSHEQVRDLMEEADALIFGIPTINRDIPKPMWDVLALLSTVKLKGNVGGVFGSFGWSGEACKMAEERLRGMNFKLPAPFVRSPFTPRPETIEQCEALGRMIAEQIP